MAQSARDPADETGPPVEDEGHVSSEEAQQAVARALAPSELGAEEEGDRGLVQTAKLSGESHTVVMVAGDYIQQLGAKPKAPPEELEKYPVGKWYRACLDVNPRHGALIAAIVFLPNAPLPILRENARNSQSSVASKCGRRKPMTRAWPRLARTKLE